jgi:hypothetical protein
MSKQPPVKFSTDDAGTRNRHTYSFSNGTSDVRYRAVASISREKVLLIRETGFCTPGKSILVNHSEKSG